MFAIALAAGVLGWAATHPTGARRARTAAGATAGTPVPQHDRPRAGTAPAGRWTLVARRTAPLTQPLQDAAGASVPDTGSVLVGGLTAADLSTDRIILVTSHGRRRIGRLPTARHDAAAVSLGGSVYLFGGGDGSRQLADVIRIDPATGAAATVGRLPAPSSDQAAAAVGGTAYVVGGFTGTRWLDTIVAWRPGTAPRVVAHLPTALRYAAVTAAANRLIIAGGSLPNGTASSAVFEFSPDSGTVTRLGRLPRPTTHAAAAAIDGVAVVIGGRGAAIDSPTNRIVTVDPGSRRVRTAGRLPAALSDATAVVDRGRILLAGGRLAAGTTDQLLELTPTPRAPTINVYAADGPNMLTGAARSARPLVYVPNSGSNTVDEIDPRTRRIVRQFAVGAEPQHVVPAYDLRTLYVTSDVGNSLTPIDPRTGRPGRPIPVRDPYNMYFTPDGRRAIVVAERLHRLDFRDPHTFRLRHSVPVPCEGVDHIDFSADGSYLLASCEFSGQILKVDVRRERIVGVLTLPDGAGGMPQDVKLAPDGRIFYVADMMANGLWEIDGATLRVVDFLPTGAGVHGLYPSRDGRFLYATNRGEGSISVINVRTRKVIDKWWLPDGGSPDMGGVSADGKVLWLSGRYNGAVYAISTVTGRLIGTISVGSGPHGLCVWPQPGRYSLGHTGILR